MNWLSNSGIWQGVAVCFLAFAHSLTNGQVVRSIEYVTQEYSQTSELGAGSTTEYRFVLDAPRTSRDTGQFLLPNGSVSIGANAIYPSLETIQAQYPPGTYTAQLEHWARPTGPPTFHALEADYPSTPVFHSTVPRVSNESWQEGALVVDPNFTLTIDPWENRPADSLIRFQLQGPTGGYTQNAYDQDLTSIAFGGEGNFQLQPNRTYEAVLTYVDFFNSVSTSIPGSSPTFPEQFRFDVGSGNSVRFTIVTVPEPRVGAIGALALGALIIFRRKRRLS
jgi:hypothetical protein